MDEKLTAEFIVKFGTYSQTELTDLTTRLKKVLDRRGPAMIKGVLGEALQEMFTEALVCLEDMKKKGASNGET